MNLLKRLLGRQSPEEAERRRLFAKAVADLRAEALPLNDALACITATYYAIQEAMATQIDQHFSSETDRRSKRFEVACEAIYFLLHAMNRMSFAAFGADVRASIHARVAPQVLEVFVRAGFGSLSDHEVAELCKELFEEMMLREAEYGALTYPSLDPLELTSSVVGRFADIVSDLAGNGFGMGLGPLPDAEAYFTTPLVVAQIVGDSGLYDVVQRMGNQLQGATASGST